MKTRRALVRTTIILLVLAGSGFALRQFSRSRAAADLPVATAKKGEFLVLVRCRDPGAADSFYGVQRSHGHAGAARGKPFYGHNQSPGEAIPGYRLKRILRTGWPVPAPNELARQRTSPALITLNDSRITPAGELFLRQTHAVNYGERQEHAQYRQIRLGTLA